MLEATVNTDLPLSQSLKELQDAADRIFDTISKRVTSQHQQLKGLSERIMSAQAKVDAISGTKRATSIYSSAKYPRADPTVADFVPLFADAAQNGCKASADTVSLDTGQWQSRDEGTLELFQFFSETSHEYWLKDHKHKDGVGKVPPGIKSVADLLLFNSTELPYHKYRVVDNLAGSEQLILQEELGIRPAPLPAAPQSVLAGDVLPRPGGDEFGFRPVLRQIPSFSLPSVLPDLPMVAEISWSGMGGGIDRLPSIAPSAVHGGPYSPRSNYSASPRFDNASASARFDPASLSARLDAASENGSVQSERKVSSRALPSLNIPATPIERSAQSKANSGGSGMSSTGSSNSARHMPSSSGISQSIPVDAPKAQTSPPRLAPAPPPPPTPPSPPFQSSPAKGTLVRKSSNLPTLPPVDSQRAALMDSIRSSGLDLLRKTPRSENSRGLLNTPGSPAIRKTDVEVPDNVPVKGPEIPEKISPPEVNKPINLMAEMARSLTLRRLSMQGTSQGPIKSDTQVPPRDEGQQSIESGRTSPSTLPNLGAHIAEGREDQSDDDDDEWD
ncbi:unnamed protein product [Calypogeia fissa]